MSVRMLWTPAVRAKLEPPFPSPPVPYPGSPWPVIQEAWADRADAITAGLAKATPEMQRLTTAVIDSMASDRPPVTLDRDVESARAALLVTESEYVRSESRGYEHAGDGRWMRITPDPKVAEALLEVWVTKAGLSFAVEAVTRAARLEPHDDAQEWWLSHRLPPKHTDIYSVVTPIWHGLRRRICSADDAGRAPAERLAETMRPTADGTTRCALAYVFPSRPEFAAQDAREAYDRVLPTGGRMHWLFASLRDIDAAKALLDRWSALGFRNRPLDIVENFGEKAMPLWEDYLRRERVLGVDSARLFYEALAVIDTDEAFALLAERLDIKEAVGAATGAFAMSPERAIRVLAGMPRSRRIDAALAPLVAANPQIVDELLPILDRSSRSVVASARATSDRSDAPDASPNELPSILVQPPWQQKTARTEAAVVIRDLVVPDLQDRIDWAPGQRDEWRSSGFSYSGEDRPRTAESDAKLLDEIAKRPSNLGEGIWVLFLLTDAAALTLWRESPVTRWWDRKNAGNLRRVLGRFDLEALPPLLTIAEADPSIGAQVLEPVRSLRVAPIMSEAFGRLKAARPLAAAWLERFPREAALALIPIAVGPAGKPRGWAGTALRHLASRGHAETVRSVATDYGSQVLEAIDRELTRDPLMQFPARLPKMPEFWNPAALPRPLLRGREKSLPLSAVEALGTMLAISRIDEPYAGLAVVREACDPESLAAFAWALFESFESAGVPSKEWWAFEALGHFGDDGVARRITPILRDWPSQGGLARATQGLDVLARIGTDVALMNLHGISQRVRSRPLQQRAVGKLQEIADARGLSVDELADRLVPDLGLDESGSRVLDLGPRQFHVGFDEQLRPFVKDAQGHRVKDLPKAAKTDDAEKAKAAAATWKAIKADARKAAGVERSRLETAMCRRRRWSDEEFRTLLAGHPLMMHLVRRLIWAIYDAGEHVTATFRVAEDGSFAGSKDETFELAATRIGIAHPLDLTAAELGRWTEIFNDYRILQPFPQLARPVHARRDDQLAATSLSDADGLTVKYGNVLALESRGWQRGLGSNGGTIITMFKPLPNAGYEAHLSLDPGLFAQSLVDSPAQKLGSVALQKAGTWGEASRLTIGELDAITYSELVADLQSLRT